MFSNLCFFFHIFHIIIISFIKEERWGRRSWQSKQKTVCGRSVSLAGMPSKAVSKRSENNDHDDDSDPEAEDAHGERGALRVGGSDVDAEAAGTREQRAAVAREGRVVHGMGSKCGACSAKSLARSAASGKPKKRGW